MQFETNRLEFLALVKKAAKVAPSKASADVLNGILIEADENNSEVLLTATNHEISIQQKIMASVLKGGSILVNSGYLLGMLSLLKGGAVTFRSDKQNELKILCERSRYGLSCLPSEHYPKPTIPFPEDTIKISGINALAKKTIFATANEDNNSILNCVSLKIRQNALQASSCDSFRIMLVKGVSQAADSSDLLIPSRALQILSSLVDDDDIFEVGEMDKEIVFIKENLLFSVRKVTGKYLNINAVLKSIVPCYRAIINSKEFGRALSLISVASNKEPINLRISDNCINLSCISELGEVKDVVGATGTVITPVEGFYYSIDKLGGLFKVIDGNVKLELDKKGMMLIKTKNEVYFQLPQMNKSAKNNTKGSA